MYRLHPPHPAGRLALLLVLVLSTVCGLRAQHDLSFFRVSSDVFPARGTEVSFTFVVTNDLGTDVNGVEVTLDVPAGLTYVSDDSGGAFDVATGLWTVGDIRYFEPQKVITIRYRADGEGVLTATGEITAMEGTDIDSTPGNGDFSEDDMMSACVSVPIRAECGQSVKLTAPGGYTGYQWYRDGAAIAGATAAVLDVGETGEYRFSVDGAVSATCALGSCCPARMSFDSISVAVSQPFVCTGGLDTVRFDVPPADDVNFTQTYAWLSPDDPLLNYLSCSDCPNPTLVVTDYPGDSLRYVVSVVTRDAGGDVVCTANATLVIGVSQAPVITFDAPAFACADDCYTIGVTTDLPYASIAWDGPFLRTPDGPTMTYCPLATPDGAPQKFVVEVVGVDGCVRRDSTVIDVTTPVEIFAAGDLDVCQNLTADLSAVLAPAPAADSFRVRWSELATNPASGTNLPVADALAVTTGNLAPGGYGFVVEVERLTPDGTYFCARRDTQLVTVQPDCALPIIGGFAWKDGNGDGIRQTFEAPMEALRVRLFDGAGVFAGLTTFTDALGYYEFRDVPLGTYAVQFDPVAFFAFTLRDAGANDAFDSDASPTGRTQTVTLSYDESDFTLGAGYFKDCQIALVNVQVTPTVCGANTGALSFDVANVTGPTTISWSPNVSSGTSATDLQSGIYFVTVYDEATECSYVEALEVTGSESFELAVTSTPTACPGGSGGSLIISTVGGEAPFSIAYAGPQSGSAILTASPYEIDDLTAGVYNVVVTDNAGCAQMADLEVEENDLTVALDVDNLQPATCGGGNDGSFRILASGYSPPYTLSINGQTVAAGISAGEFTAANQSAGAKLVELTDATDCAQSYSFVLEDEAPTIDLATVETVDASCFDGRDGSIASTIGQRIEVRTSAGVLVGLLPQRRLGADTYTLVDRSVPGCVQSATVTIGQPNRPGAFASVRGTDCDVDEGVIEVSGFGGTAPYTYTWNRGLPDGPEQTGLAAGSYELRMFDANDCRFDTVLVVEDLCGQLACERFFTVDTVVLETAAAATDWCLSNFSTPLGRTFTVDGEVIQPQRCLRDRLVSYDVTLLPGEGADGPYVLEFWFGGDALAFAETVSTPEDITAVLDRVDAWGRWQYDEDARVIVGGQPDRAYGEIEVKHVASGVTIFLSPERRINQTSVSYSFANPGAYDLATTNPGDDCVDSVHVIVRDPDVCADRFVAQDAFATTPYCSEPSNVCIDLPYGLSDDYALFIDGAPYTGTTSPCDETRDFFYDLAGVDLGGVLEIDNWIVDRRFRRGLANSPEELAARMSYLDNEVWTYDPYRRILVGGNPDHEYRDLNLETATGSARLGVRTGVVDGTVVTVLPGVHAATLVDFDGCEQTFAITVTCETDLPPSTDTVRWMVGIGIVDTLCLDTEQVPGEVVSATNVCEERRTDVALIDTLGIGICLRGEGLELGFDTLCIVACDVNQVCDTTIVIAEVLNAEDFLFPEANPDLDSMAMNGSALVSVLDNDRIPGALESFEIVQYPRFGWASIEGENVSYLPKDYFCGSDSLVYEICNASGCDTATVDLLVTCEQLIIFSGFSPNFDDINETFTVLGVEQYVGNVMTVYNRWGNKVFEMDEYDNSWDGTYFDGSELPEGTYFYVFEDGRGATYTGYVYLKR